MSQIANLGQNVDKDFQERLKDEAVATDMEDLIAVLLLRFGSIPQVVQQQIEAMTDGSTLERLVLVAANVPTFRNFVDELGQGKEAFRMVGEGFNPLSHS